MELQRPARTFHLEIGHPIDFNTYCGWHDHTEEENRRNQESMRSEFNLRDGFIDLVPRARQPPAAVLHE